MASQEVITALETLHREIEKLEPAIKHVEMAQLVTETVKTIPQKHVALLEEISKSDARYKEELKDLIEKVLLNLANENGNLQKTTSEIQKQAKLELDALGKLKEKVMSFHEKVEKINFPERLDKLDANVAGIMAAVQSVQSRLDSLERNITDRLKDIQEYQKETRVTLESRLEQSVTSLKTLSYITMVVVIVAALIITFLK